MEKNEIHVGLDIGTTKICVIVGRKNEYGKIDILGMGKSDSVGVMRGMVSNIEKTVDSIKKALVEASQKSDVEIKVVNVGIAGQHIESIQHRGLIVRNNGEDEITKEDTERLISDMHKVVMNPGSKIIHVIPQDYTVDGEHGIKDPVGMAGVRLEGNFHIITAKDTSVKNIQRCVQKSGLEMSGLTLEPLASSLSVLSEEEKEAGVALIDIGGGTTDLAIFQDNIIRHTAVIPLGGEIITRDIQEGCNVLMRQAEVLKMKFGSALADEAKENEIISIPGIKGREPREISVKNLAHIIQARMEEIFEHIQYEIKASGFERKLIGGIVLTGGGAKLKHATQLAEYIMGHDVRVGYPNEHLAKGMAHEVNSPMYATSIGLIMDDFQNTQMAEMNSRSNAATTFKSKAKSDNPKGSGWLESIFQKGKDFLANDDLDDYEK